MAFGQSKAIRKLQRYSIPVYSGIPGIPVYSVYSLYTRNTLYSRVFRVFPVFPCIPGITRYSRDYPVFPGLPGIPGIPCIPVYSLYSRLRAPREAVEPRGPFWLGGGVRGVGYGVVCRSTPPGYAPWAYPGGVHAADHPVHHPPHPATAPERASGLNGLAGYRVEHGPRGHAAPGFPYLRSIWPGNPDGLQAIWGSRWIGSRAPPAKGRGMSVTWNVCQKGAQAGSGDVRSRIRRPHRRRIRLLRRRIRLFLYSGVAEPRSDFRNMEK